MTTLTGSSTSLRYRSSTVALPPQSLQSEKILASTGGNAARKTAPVIAPIASASAAAPNNPAPRGLFATRGAGLLNPNAPELAFAISCTEDSLIGPYFVVQLFRSNKEMMAYEHREVRRSGEFWALCDCLTGHEWNPRAPDDCVPVGTILFSRDHLTHGLVAHEIAVHAAMHFGHLRGLQYRRLARAPGDWTKANGSTPETEEHLAMLAEILIRNFYAGLAEHGIVISTP